MIKTKEGDKRTRSVFKYILISVLLLFAAGGAVMILCLGGDGLFGYQARIVLSSSMEKNPQTDVGRYAIRDIPAGSLVLIKLVPKGEEAQSAFYSDLKTGDVLTFSYRIIGGSAVITHRIKSIERRGNGYTIVLCGDNGTRVGTQTIDTADSGSPNRVIGKVVLKSHFLGVLLCVLRQPQCFAVFCMVVTAAALAEPPYTRASLLRAEVPPHRGNYEK